MVREYGRARNSVGRLLDIAFEQRFKPTILGNDVAINEENGLPACLTCAEILLLIVVKTLTGHVRTLPRKSIFAAPISRQDSFPRCYRPHRERGPPRAPLKTMCRGPSAAQTNGAASPRRAPSSNCGYFPPFDDNRQGWVGGSAHGASKITCKIKRVIF